MMWNGCGGIEQHDSCLTGLYSILTQRIDMMCEVHSWCEVSSNAAVPNQVPGTI